MTPRDVIREAAAGLLPARLRADYEHASRERRDAIDDALIWRVHHVAGPYLQGRYPSYDVGARLILGATPTELAPGLTAREARAWVQQTDHQTPAAWLAHTIAQREGWDTLRSDHVAVLRWVEKRIASPKTRPAMLRRIRRVDELLPSDIVGASVRTTFAKAEARAARDGWDGPDELISHEAWMDDLPDGLTVLRTIQDLYEEGVDQEHCVRTYAGRVYGGQCLIIRVQARGGERSTAEVVRGKIVQHLGRRNSDPPAACVALLRSGPWTS